MRGCAARYSLCAPARGRRWEAAAPAGQSQRRSRVVTSGRAAPLPAPPRPGRSARGGARSAGAGTAHGDPLCPPGAELPAQPSPAAAVAGCDRRARLLRGRESGTQRNRLLQAAFLLAASGRAAPGLLLLNGPRHSLASRQGRRCPSSLGQPVALSRPPSSVS